jgi:predicted Fe-Mo cluster-binding NifX family protein
VAEVGRDGIATWDEFHVGWSQFHGGGTPELHEHIARFLREHAVRCVAVAGMSETMAELLADDGIIIRLGLTGSAREALLAAASGAHSE